MDKYIRTFAEINLDAIHHNFTELKNCVKSGTKLCAVIKADGYGHGAVTLAAFLENEIDCIAVATADEAIELRNSGIKKPILILSYTHKDDYDALIKNDIELTVFSLKDAENMQAAAEKIGKKALVHISVDTGMTRIGFIPNSESAAEVKKIQGLKNIEIKGIFSHYACADMTDKSTSERQTKKYTDFVKECEAIGVVFPIHHLCNSAAISEFNNHFDMVRMGISLYGLYPSEFVDKKKVDLHPAMTLKSHVILVKTVPAGEGISYGHIYKTESERKIATVSAGYADGYPRALSNRGHVIVRGEFAPIVGKVCMDQVMIDVTDIPDVAVDDEVILIGSDNGKTVSAEEIGEMSESFNYEVVCGVARRVPRVYKKDGKTVSIINYLRKAD